MKLAQQEKLNEVAFEVIGNGKVAEINCNGNIFVVEKAVNQNKVYITNPLGTCIGDNVYELWRIFNNTVVDSIEFYNI